MNPPEPVHRRRVRYSGANPRRFDQKYKERDPEAHPEVTAKVLASGKTPAGSHRPICVPEVLHHLDPRPGQRVVDATLGHGGHAEQILPLLAPGGALLGLDTDPIELPRTEARLRALGHGPESFAVRHTNYAALPAALAAQGWGDGVHGLLADLGCSSMQLDDPARGFTYKHDGPLDLRLNPLRGQPAAALLARLDEDALARLLDENADEPLSGPLAAHLTRLRARSTSPATTRALAQAVRDALHALPVRQRPADSGPVVRRVFQALRIAVNDEFATLDALLRHLPAALLPGGRAVLLTFHSGEDRRVKLALQEGLRSGLYSAVADPVERPTPDEIAANPRASSAKLRWAIRACLPE